MTDRHQSIDRQSLFNEEFELGRHAELRKISCPVSERNSNPLPEHRRLSVRKLRQPPEPEMPLLNQNQPRLRGAVRILDHVGTSS